MYTRRQNPSYFIQYENVIGMHINAIIEKMFLIKFVVALKPFVVIAYL